MPKRKSNTLQSGLALYAICPETRPCLWGSSSAAETHWQTAHNHGEGPSVKHAVCYSAWTRQNKT